MWGRIRVWVKTNTFQTLSLCSKVILVHPAARLSFNLLERTETRLLEMSSVTILQVELNAFLHCNTGL